MTTQDAREILSVFRPGTADEQDPIFTEALELARTDPELKAWFEENCALDRTMKAELARVSAPADLRETILASRKIIRPAPWWNPRLKAHHWAAAAAVALMAGGIALWLGHRPISFREFQHEIADQAWGPVPHVEHKAATLADVRRSLEQHGVQSQFPIPPTLAQASVRGYSLMHWRGHEVPMICFHSEGQHLHLLVVDRHLFPDAPSSGPRMEQWDSWRTASWSRDDFSYVLTGLSTPHFVKKFRKSKRWDWEG